MTQPPPDPKVMTEELIIQAREPLRYLYFKETGQDPGPLHATMVDALKKRYHTHMWGMGNDRLKRELNRIRDDLEREKVKRELTLVLMNIKPFLERWKKDKQIARQFA